ncbi:MAG TPA: hypothetical protein PLM70_10185 [Bacteroidales bacterium]|nr:hypothetical protein [Bacteroidales bacterium]
MKGHYNKDSKLDFGMYKGYELGIVYVFDPSYVDWCINNIDRFYISDLDELKEYGVINEKLDWQYKMIGDPSLIPNIDIFDTFQELIDNVNLGEKKYNFSDETLKKNESKSFNKSSSNFDLDEDDDFEDDYEGGDFREEYDDYDGHGGGYDDWDDQRTWGQKRGLCDIADNCYGCPYADQCF